MTGRASCPNIAALRKLEASLQSHLPARRACTRTGRVWSGCNRRLGKGGGGELVCAWVAYFLRRSWQRPKVRKLAYGAGAVFGVFTLACVALAWRLSSGPIAFDLATPWLTSAIEQNFGGRHRVEVGGTQIERDEHGRTALRIRDIVVRDADGTVVASAPKAEVGIAGTSLFTGRMRAERLSLVGAEMAVRIEPDGKVRVFAGADRRPIATASVGSTTWRPWRRRPPRSRPDRSARNRTGAAASRNSPRCWPGSTASGRPDSTGMISARSASRAATWWSTTSAAANAGRSRRSISASPARGRAPWCSMSAPRIPERPWLLSAALIPREVRPAAAHRRCAQSAAARSPARRPHGRGPDRGRPVALRPGARRDRGRRRAATCWRAGWSARTVTLPIRTIPTTGWRSIAPSSVSTGMRRAGCCWCRSRSCPAAIASRCWPGSIRRARPAARGRWGCPAAPSCSRPPAAEEPPLILNRILVRAGRSIRTSSAIQLEQADFGNADIKVALSGHLRFFRQRSAACARRGRQSHERIGAQAIVARLHRAEGAQLGRGAHRQRHGRAHGGRHQRAGRHAEAGAGRPFPMTDSRSRSSASGTLLRPVADLPPIRDADLHVRITGRTATINLGRGIVELSPGRKLTISNGTFEVPDTFQVAPPARARFRIEGPVPAAVELLGAERLREASTTPLEPTTSRGNVSAQVSLGNAAAQRPAAGGDELRDHYGRVQFRRRPHGHGPQGRGGEPEGDRQQSGLSDQGRREDRRHAGRARISPRQGRRAMPRSASRRRSTKARAPVSDFDMGTAITGPVADQARRPHRRRGSREAGSPSKPI